MFDISAIKEAVQPLLYCVYFRLVILNITMYNTRCSFEKTQIIQNLV